ncbi:uncharacterized protein LOC110412436 [Herrania umbratica]|uniref:Uncharacterized protein LOC110412436 n=1 Tax=Herrania umbratica TaxID=108875 RepID=A0A6J0ZV83_9ROSI|nr:uncharacterized protein LOC110412436 [Herrania umbratica]
MHTSTGDMAARHAILGFLILAFMPFLLLKYRDPDASPFDDGNSIIMLVFCIATLTYVAAMVTELRLRIRGVECPNVISNVSYLSASLAAISLVTILFPYLGWFLFVIWIGFCVKLSLDAYLELFQPLASGASYLWNKQEKNDDRSSATASTPDSPV